MDADTDSMKTLPPHHPDDLRDMRDCITAVVEEKFDHVCVAGLEWLDTDEGKNHRHILGLWDANEDEDYYNELAERNPVLLALYLADAAEMYPHEDETKARAAYVYGFDLFDDVVEILRGELELRTASTCDQHGS